MLKFLHLSDLHIAGEYFWFRYFNFFPINSPRPLNRQKYPWPSKEGHDERVLDDLTIFWGKLKKFHSDVKIFISGDLTRVGGGPDFGNSHRYLHASWKITQPHFLHTGLKSNCETAYTVPGNHDYWDNVLLNPNVKNSAIRNHFWDLSWQETFRDSHIEVHVIGLDSCSGLFNMSFKQFVAIGAVSPEQLDAAEKQLKEAKTQSKNRKIDSILRVAVIHHPPEHLENRSKRQLNEWLNKNKVSCVLVGHEHIPTLPIGNSPPFVFKCGTTSQAGSLTHLPGKAPNHFFLHTIERSDQNSLDFLWKTYEWQYSGSNWVEHPNNPIWQRIIKGIQP